MNIVGRFISNLEKKYMNESVDSKNFLGRFGLKRDLPRYDFASKYVKGKKVLNVACGHGHGIISLLVGKPEKILSVDIDKNVINKANKKYGSEICLFVNQDVNTLNLDMKNFDTIVSIETIEHIKDPELMIRNLIKHSKINSTFIFSTPNGTISKKTGYMPKFHVKEYSTLEMYNILKKYFSDVQIFHQMPFKKKSLLKLRAIIALLFRPDVIMPKEGGCTGFDNIYVCKGI